MKWFEVDERWDLYGIKSREDFVEKFVVEGKFHNQVPADIVSAFETVSYLLANSYSHWQLQDEALNKALLIMEMAIKLKANELNIDLKLLPNKKGHVFEKKLSIIIDEICSKSELSFLKPDFDRARNLRNHAVHPDRHSFMGGLSQAKGNFMLFNNIINLMFLQDKEIQLLLKNRLVISDKLEVFKNSLFVLETSKHKILIDTIHFHKYVSFNYKELLILLVNPILLNVYENLTQNKFPEPLLVILKEFKIEDSKINGFDIENNPVMINYSDKLANILTLKTYSEEIAKLEIGKMSMYNAYRSEIALWEMERIIYSNVG
jgi:hypothetical protein